ncbi:hypothetical protein RhiJN_00047 [Ceratobasidium sp. AG-Ba]|nr:hypothetical protein RhiJN_00047 [Ceratobasidium sp. AG-Ba]
MPPVCAESSTVSIPPREKRPAKRNEKACKQKAHSGPPGPPNPPGPPIGAKRKAKQPILTLAGQRQRRANEVAYVSRPDGIHIKRVVRRSSDPGLPLAVPYLPGQEDLPHSDAESDSTDATILEISTIPTQDSGVDMEVDTDEFEGVIEPAGVDKELWDYDAEGEDEDENTATKDTSHTSHPFLAGWATYPSTSNIGASSCDAPNLLANTSDEDMAALLGGLGDLHFAGNNPRPSSSFPIDFTLPYGSTGNITTGRGCNILSIGSGAEQGFTAAGSSRSRSPDFHHGFPIYQVQPQLDRLSTPDFTLGRAHNDIAPDPTSHGLASRTGTPARQRSIDLMPPPRLPQTQIPLSPSSVSVPLPRLARHDTPHPFASRTGSPIASGHSVAATTSYSHSRPSTRDLVAQTRAQVRSSALASVLPSGLTPGNNDEDDDIPPTLEPTPLRVSLSLPEFLHKPISPNGPELTLAVRLEDTDIGLSASSPRQYTQPHTVAQGFRNVNISPNRPTNLRVRQPPTLLELKTNALTQLKTSARNHRGRRTTDASQGGSTLHTGNLTIDQRRVLASMEYHILKDVVCTNPWPSDRDPYLLAATNYAVAMTGVRDPEVYTPKFQDMVYSKTSANHGGTLRKVECMVEHSLGLLSREKGKIMALLQHNQVFFPTKDRNPGEYFCVKLLVDVLEIIFFGSGKPIGLVFMEELCKPDDPVKCAHWHKKLCDPTATHGVSPAAIAFAAAQIYWALEKMYLGTNLHFDEQHFRVIWEQYFRAILKLQHLKALRLALLDQLKLYYMDHWPAEERDEEDESFMAW